MLLRLPFSRIFLLLGRRQRAPDTFCVAPLGAEPSSPCAHSHWGEKNSLTYDWPAELSSSEELNKFLSGHSPDVNLYPPTHVRSVAVAGAFKELKTSETAVVKETTTISLPFPI